MQNNFKGRSAIVTGAGRGIGREVALLLAREGAKVMVCDPGVGRNGESTGERVADEVAAEINKSGGVAIASYDSVSDFKLAAAMVDRCVKEFGSIDLMINVAGILRERMIWNMSEEDFDMVIDVHLKGTWNMSRHAIRYMREAGFGRIVNFGSSVYRGAVGQCNYAAAKAGIIGLSRSITMEAYKYGITCNVVCPSADTRMTQTPEVKANRERKFKAGLMSKQEYERQSIPRGPEFIAPFVGYLCTDDAYYINGQVFHVERGALTNYYFGEIRKKVTKEEDEGMFTVEQLKREMPKVMEGATSVAPEVKPQEAQKYVNQRVG